MEGQGTIDALNAANTELINQRNAMQRHIEDLKSTIEAQREALFEYETRIGAYQKSYDTVREERPDAALQKTIEFLEGKLETMRELCQMQHDLLTQ